jgi:hypothetical protein
VAILKRLQAGQSVVVAVEGFDPPERERLVRLAHGERRPRHMILIETSRDQVLEEERPGVDELRRALDAGELGREGFETVLRLGAKSLTELKRIVVSAPSARRLTDSTTPTPQSVDPSPAALDARVGCSTIADPPGPYRQPSNRRSRVRIPPPLSSFDAHLDRAAERRALRGGCRSKGDGSGAAVRAGVALVTGAGPVRRCDHRTGRFRPLRGRFCGGGAWSGYGWPLPIATPCAPLTCLFAGIG